MVYTGNTDLPAGPSRYRKGEKLGEKAVLIETGTASNVEERKKMVRVERI